MASHGVCWAGYATEAAQVLTTFAFDKLGSRRVEIHIDGHNRRSRAVAERLGFECEATLKAHGRNNRGQLCDTRIYAMFNRRELTTAEE